MEGDINPTEQGWVADESHAQQYPLAASNLGWKETLVDSGVRFMDKRLQ